MIGKDDIKACRLAFIRSPWSADDIMQRLHIGRHVDTEVIVGCIDILLNKNDLGVPYGEDG